MQWENVTCLEIDDLVDFEAQPFKVVDDEAMHELVDSIKTVGVLVPIIVRRMKEGKYEIISGHRRKRACEIAGKNTIPAVVTELNDDEAAILLVDSNLQREKLLPSERAYAYKMKLEALKHTVMDPKMIESDIILINQEKKTEIPLDRVKVTCSHPGHAHPQMSPDNSKISYTMMQENGDMAVRIAFLQDE